MMLDGRAALNRNVAGRPTLPKPAPKRLDAVWRFGAFLLQSERRLVAGILLVSLAHGLIYLFIEPPWEHYEEPSHFEYAWLIAHSGRLPEYPAFDQSERRLIAGSMIAHGFFDRRPLGLPDLNSTDQPIWIGINTTGAKPLYHLLVALPLRLAAGAGVDIQLYVARLVSLALFVLTIALAYLLMAELVPSGHGLRWAVPLGLALTPGFVDLMTAVNNDVGATFIFSLFLWATVRLVMRGFTFARLVGVLILAILCVLTKDTVFVAALLVVVPVSMALSLRIAAGRHNWPASLALRRALPRVLLALPLLAMALGLGLSLDWGDPALWYRTTARSTPARIAVSPAAPGLGNQALGFTHVPGQPDVGRIKQVVPSDRVLVLRGHALTLGAWIWATQPVIVNGPTLISGRPFSPTAVTVGTQPAFFSWPVSIANDVNVAWVLVDPNLGNDSARPVTVYYDGIVLVSEARPVEATPVFADTSASQGTWSGKPFVNEVRNASIEQAWPRVRPWAERFITGLAAAHISPSVLLGAVLDWRVGSPYYLVTAVRLFRTFWGSFAWGNVALAPVSYVMLRYITLLGLGAAVLRLLQAFGSLSRPRQLAIAWLGLALLAIWAEVFLRGLFTVLDARPYIPTARYAYPVMIPSMLLLVAGWGYWPWKSERLTGLLKKYGPVLFCTAFLVLDVHSVATILTYYSR